MKLSKKKVFTLALAVCMLATLSLGSLAWFTDQDAATNNFMIAGSDGEDADDIFSVEVSEKSEDPDAKETEDGIQYDKILPGDTLSKVVSVTNTGSYNQYIRVKIEVSNAELWQGIYQADMVPVTEFVDLDVTRTDLYGVGSYMDQETDSFVYYLYFTEELEPEENMDVFNNAFVAGALTKEQAFDIDGKFTIKVTADAVQTENVGDNVYEAFKTVGMEIPVNTLWVAERDALIESFLNDGYYIVLNADIKLNLAHKIAGTDAVLYMNGKTLDTTPGSDKYGVTMEGNLTVDGIGTLVIRAAGMQVKGTLTWGEGVTRGGQGIIVDADCNEITLQ